MVTANKIEKLANSQNIPTDELTELDPALYNYANPITTAKISAATELCSLPIETVKGVIK